MNLLRMMVSPTPLQLALLRMVGLMCVETKGEKEGMRSHLWLLGRRTFQTPFDKSAPVDKVSSAIAYPTTTVPDDAGYRQPARANTIFPFRFVLPTDAGSAVEFAQDVRTRYTLTGYAKVRILGSFETLVHSIEVSKSHFEEVGG